MRACIDAFVQQADRLRATQHKEPTSKPTDAEASHLQAAAAAAAAAAAREPSPSQ